MKSDITLIPACGTELELDVEALVSDGRGLGRHKGMVVLAQGAFPGQTVRVRIVASRRKLLEGEVTAVIRRSPEEQRPSCPHAEACGGCPWQSLPYDRQLFWKKRQIEDALKRIGKLQDISVESVMPSPEIWGYRNKMEFAFGADENGKPILGLRERGTRRVVEVNGCLLQSPLTMRVLSAMRELLGKDAFLGSVPCRFLVVRQPRAGGCLVELILGPKRAEKTTWHDFGVAVHNALRVLVPEITGFVLSRRASAAEVAYGEKTLYVGGEELRESIGHVRLRLGHNAFFQVNTLAAEHLYAIVARLADLVSLETPLVWDIYSGVGSIGLYLAEQAGEIVGIETMPGAVRYALRNAAEMGILHYRVEAGEARMALKRLLRQHRKPDVIVVDPPRAGMDAATLESLCEAAPCRLVYVSCNPATLARDIARLAPVFRPVFVQPVDLFPQTPHVESVSLLKRR